MQTTRPERVSTRKRRVIPPSLTQYGAESTDRQRR
jgi:hypothetical protein